MRLSTLAASPGGASSVPASLPVTEEWGPAPGRQFRAVRYLGFSCGSLAEGVSLEPGSADLAAEFLPLDYDALHPPAPLGAAAVREQGDFLVVELGGVRRVRRVILEAGPATRRATVEVYRLDGDRPGAEPAVTAEAGWREDVSVAAAEEGSRAAAAPAHAPAEKRKAGGAVVFALPDGFDDARFALRVTNDGDVATLGAADLLGVGVRSAPANPRLGLAVPPPAAPGEEDPDPLADLLLLWPDPASAPAPAATRAQAGPLLEAALKAHLARRVEELRAGGGPLSARLDVALVAAADAPCTLRWEAFGVDYHLERVSLEPPSEKVLLRFPADRAEPRDVCVKLPRGAKVVSAIVEASLSRVGGGGGLSAPAAAPNASAGGLSVREGEWCGQRLDLTGAVLAEGLGLGLLGLSAGAELTAEVRADAGGVPAGRRLASGRASLGVPGAPRWAAVPLGEAVLAPSGPLWVLLRAVRGRAVWLAGAGGGGAAAARVSAGAEEVAVLKGSELLCSLTSGAAALPAGAPAGGLRLVLGDTTAVPSASAGGPATFDAGPGLVDALAKAGAGDPATLALHFWADPGTLLTVYPPRVVYDL